MKRFAGWLALIAVVIGLDQWSKLTILQHFQLFERRQVTSFFDLVLVYNPGAAFSFLADHGGWQKWFFVVLAFVISAWLLTLIWRQRESWLQPWAFSMVVGGALGNVIDRFTYGAVVDFLAFHLDTHYWPAFNLADSAICLGVGLMLLAQWREKPGPQKN